MWYRGSSIDGILTFEDCLNPSLKDLKVDLIGKSIEPSALYGQLKSLAANRPASLRAIDEAGKPLPEVQLWLGRLFALVEASGDLMDTALLRTEMGKLRMIVRDRGFFAENEIIAILYRALAKAELRAPVSARGAFIAVGDHFDAFSALAHVFATASNNILIVDPYMDETILTDFSPLAQENAAIRLLTDEATVKPSLAPGLSRWAAQYRDTRNVEAKLAAPKQLHDRLIIVDLADVWIVTQSFKDFAARSPGSIAKAEADAARLKVEAYSTIWDAAKPL